MIDGPDETLLYSMYIFAFFVTSSICAVAETPHCFVSSIVCGGRGGGTPALIHHEKSLIGSNLDFFCRRKQIRLQFIFDRFATRIYKLKSLFTLVKINFAFLNDLRINKC